MTLDLDAMEGRAKRVLRDDKTMGGPGPEMANAVLALAEEVRHYQRALVEHHGIHNLSDEAVRESLGGFCQICARAAKKVSA